MKTAAGAVALGVLSGCGPPSTPGAPAGAGGAVRATFGAAPAPPLRSHPKRLAASLPFPDGHAWRIDAHSRPELVATHPPTRSELIVAIFRTDDLVGRTQCEALARSRKFVPGGELRTLEDEVTFTQQTFDTRVWVAVEPGRAPNRALAGYVMAFGGFLPN